MNPNYDSADEQSSTEQLEEQLKRLKPSPVSFEAEAILAASGEPDQVALLDRSGKRSERPVRWLAVSSAFTCGAVVGALLSCLVLIRSGASETVTTNEPNMQPSHESTEIKPDLPIQIVGKLPHDEVFSESKWSRDEWYISAQVLEDRALRSTNHAPLMAGDLMRRTVSIDSRDERISVDMQESDVDLAAANQHDPEDKKPFRSMDRAQLLDELLGNSRL